MRRTRPEASAPRDAGGTATTVSARDEPAAGHPRRRRHARVPRPGREAAGRRGPDRPRPAAHVAHGQDGGRCAARRRRTCCSTPAGCGRAGSGMSSLPGRRLPAPRGSAADPLQAGSRDTPPTVLESVREMRADVLDLRSAAVPETAVGATVDATFEPLLQAVLRPASATWHGRPDLATSAATAAGTRIGELRDSVRVLPPPSPYSLGTTDAPAAADGGERAPGDDGGAPEHLQHHRPAGGADPAAADPAAGPAAGAGQRGGRAVGAVLGGGDGAQPGGPGARSAEPPAGALHRLRHDHGVVDGIRGRAARRAGGAPGGAPGAGRAEPARPDGSLGRPPGTRGPDARAADRRTPGPEPAAAAPPIRRTCRRHRSAQRTRNPRRRRCGTPPDPEPPTRPVPARRP